MKSQKIIKVITIYPDWKMKVWIKFNSNPIQKLKTTNVSFAGGAKSFLPYGCQSSLTQKHQFTSSLKSGSRVNHRATAHLCPLVTAFTPCGFSPPDEKPTILPHLGFTDAWRGWKRRSRNASEVKMTIICSY